jgi:folate-binding protein YgfZ
MKPLTLHNFHAARTAAFCDLNGLEAVAHYQDPSAEYAAIHERASVLDLSFRSRLCLTGADRLRFLHGQVTNDVLGLAPESGCYAALVSAKGKMVSDLNLYRLADEILLDFEPGLAGRVSQRLEQFIIADDVRVADPSDVYSLLSVQGPGAAAVVEAAGIETPAWNQPFSVRVTRRAGDGDLYAMVHARLGTCGCDLFIPTPSLETWARELEAAAIAQGGSLAGWDALETARIEAGIPRFGVDLDETTLPPEAGIESRAISTSKGCYIGQEILARIRTYGHVNRKLHGLRCMSGLKNLPRRGDKVYKGDLEIGYVTSATYSPTLKTNVALAYLSTRGEAATAGSELRIPQADAAIIARVVPLPFIPQRRSAVEA